MVLRLRSSCSIFIEAFVEIPLSKNMIAKKMYIRDFTEILGFKSKEYFVLPLIHNDLRFLYGGSSF